MFQSEFEWKEESEKLNLNVIQAITPEQKQATFDVIKTIGRAATQLIGDKLDNLSAETRNLAAHTCAHAAWILVVSGDAGQAQTYLEFAEKFSDLPINAYVGSAVKRGLGDFEGALVDGLNAAEQFGSSQENAFLVAHAYDQAGLASLRLNSAQDAKQHLETARKIALLSSEPLTKSYAYNLIMSSEGSIIERTLVNLAQVYNKLGEHQSALDCFDEMSKHDLPQLPLNIAYRNNVHAEAHIGLQQYDEAKVLLEEASALFRSENQLQSPNYLRTLLGLLEISQGRNEPLQHLEEATALHAIKVGNKPAHDFSVRLEQAQAEAYIGLSAMSCM